MIFKCSRKQSIWPPRTKELLNSATTEATKHHRRAQVTPHHLSLTVWKRMAFIGTIKVYKLPVVKPYDFPGLYHEKSWILSFGQSKHTANFSRVCAVFEMRTIFNIQCWLYSLIVRKSFNSGSLETDRWCGVHCMPVMVLRSSCCRLLRLLDTELLHICGSSGLLHKLPVAQPYDLLPKG